MHGKVEKEVVRFYLRERPGPILGSQVFMGRILVCQGRKDSNREIPERHHLAIEIEACEGAKWI